MHQDQDIQDSFSNCRNKYSNVMNDGRNLFVQLVSNNIAKHEKITKN